MALTILAHVCVNTGAWRSYAYLSTRVEASHAEATGIWQIHRLLLIYHCILSKVVVNADQQVSQAPTVHENLPAVGQLAEFEEDLPVVLPVSTKKVKFTPRDHRRRNDYSYNYMYIYCWLCIFVLLIGGSSAKQFNRRKLPKNQRKVRSQC